MTVSGVSPGNLAVPTEVQQASRGAAADSAQVKGTPATPAKAEPTATAKEQASRREVEEAVQKVVKFVEPLKSQLQFSLDDQSGQMVVRVVDQATKEVIRQIPSEEMVAIAQALDRLQGLLVRQSA